MGKPARSLRSMGFTDAAWIRTNTSPGSSGSPCFDKGWNLVALHHSGDPAGVLRHNQGVPIGAIRRLLESRGKLNLVGV